MLNKIIMLTGPLFFRNLVRVQNRIQSKHKVRSDKLENSYYVFEARRLGINVEVIMDDVLQLHMGDQSYNVWRGNTDLDGWGSLRLAGDKVYCYSTLEKAGIPIPRYTVLKSANYKNAVAFKEKIDTAIVIKPARGTADGLGVFLRPRTKLAILLAAGCAGVYGKEIIAEEYVQGTNYRLLYCKGRFLAASARIPAFATGDGVHSILELIEKLNENRREIGDLELYDPSSRPILYKVPISRALEKVVKRQGFKLSSVPERGVVVRLQEICHWLYGGEYHDVTDIISPELIEIGSKAVKAVGIKLGGVDLIAQNIHDPKDGNYVINEINTTPNILVHYEVQNQDKMRPVARDILKIMFGLE